MNVIRPPLVLVTLAFIANSLPNLVHAAEASCTATPKAHSSAAESILNQRPNQPDNLPTRVIADSVDSLDQSTLHLTGNVRVQKGHQRVDADDILYNRDTGALKAQNNILFEDQNLTIRAERIEMDMEADKGSFLDSSYSTAKDGAQGKAQLIEKDTETIILTESTYSTCPPDAQSWHLQTNELKLDDATATGTAKHLTIRVHDVPVLYLPYLQFPTSEERRSGVLLPKIGYGDIDGFKMEVPYYFNLAPQYDDTFTPRYFAKRGTMLENEFRYITEPDIENTVFLQFLPNDDRFSDEDRKTFSWDHQAIHGRYWRTLVDYNYVSDKQFFEDFGNDLETLTQVYIPKTGEITYWGPDFRFGVRVEAFQEISALKPYQKMPQLTLALTPQRLPGGFTFDAKTEAIEFTRNPQDIHGQRFDITSSISRPFGGSAYFFTPKISARHTQYELENQTPGFEQTISRSIPSGSLDGGLFFEREIDWFDTEVIQTLEPRLYYLHVPTRRHDGIPLFDTSPFTFGYDQLFRDNRFTGIDRIGDTQQLTVALTSRLFSTEDGNELLRASLGQIFYFDEREVQLNTTTSPTDESESDYVGDITAKLGTHWSARYGIVWNNDTNRTTSASVALQYKNLADDKIFNIAYYTRANELEQADLSFVWPLADSFNLLGRSNYSIQDQRSIENLFGIEYDTCCWSVRLVDRHQLNSESKLRRSTLLEFELKGLGSVGNSIRNMLSTSILGYPRDSD